jgi:hypothetical protein
MAFLLLSGPRCNGVFWKIKSHCEKSQMIMGSPTKPFVVFFLPAAKKTLDKIFSKIHVDTALEETLLGDDALSRFLSFLIALVSSQ